MTKNVSQRELQDLRAIHDSGGVRIVFEWPQGEAFVRVVRVPATQPVATCDPLPNGTLLTHDEYKQRGGYIPPGEVGRFTFQFPPYINQLTCITARGRIDLQLRRKRGWGAWTAYIMKVHVSAQVPAGVLGYKKIAAVSATKGDLCPDMVYSFDEPLHMGNTTRHILTKKNERLAFFIADETHRDIYDLFMQYK